MSAVVLRGDARNLPLPDGSVDLIVTSPPYFGLRSYTDNGQHYKGQIGSEETPAEYIDSLLSCTREWVRVLKPEGSIFVNLGDSYYSGKGAPGKTTTDPKNAGRNARRTTRSPLDYGLDFPRKTLLGLPWRYALGCIDDLGLILRAEICWSKANCLPESVRDRVRQSHEQIFHFVKSARYYSAVDEIREPHQPQSIARTRRNRFAPDLSQEGVGSPNTLDPADSCNPLGKLPGSVWEIPSAPLSVPAHLQVTHFAAYPPELCRRLILGWSPSGICLDCWQGRTPVCDRTPMMWRPSPTLAGRQNRSSYRPASGTMLAPAETRITGYACACPQPVAPTTPALVVDPFGGTGTTSLVADVLGRTGISVDRSADYCRLARWRTTDPGERARAMGVPKPPPVSDGQASLFDLTGGEVA